MTAALVYGYLAVVVVVAGSSGFVQSERLSYGLLIGAILLALAPVVVAAALLR